MFFQNRKEAGQKLLSRLRDYSGHPAAVVLAIPRGGVELGFEIAKGLGLPLDIAVARKIGAPGNPEFAIGAIAPDGTGIFDRNAIAQLNVTPDYLNAKVEEEKLEAQRRLELYRAGMPALDVSGQMVLLVDDGIATGATVRAALAYLQKQGAARVIVVAPVMSRSAYHDIRNEADDVVCLDVPASFWSVGEFYGYFPQVSDEEVIRMMRHAVS